MQVSKGESDYSGVGSGFCSQWDRVMLAIFLSVLYKSYQNLERPDLYRIWVKSIKANSTINTVHSVLACSPLHACLYLDQDGGLSDATHSPQKHLVQRQKEGLPAGLGEGEIGQPDWGITRMMRMKERNKTDRN